MGRTIAYTHTDETLISKVNTLGQGGMGHVETITINPTSPVYKTFLAEVAAWAEVRGDFRDVEIRFSKIRQEIKDYKANIEKLMAKKSENEVINQTRNELCESVKTLRSMQFEYVNERIDELVDKSDKELKEWITSLGKEIPIHHRFALKSTFSQNSEMISRTREEFVILNLLQDENITTVYTCGDGFYIMELLDGYIQGEKLIKECKTLAEIKSKVNIIIEGCKAIEKMHAIGIIHRDIKPDNLMVKDQKIKFIDLGIAKSNESLNLTIEGSLLGTPAYMSEDQVLGKTPTYNNDIYALGATLYSLLTGKEPYSVYFNENKEKTLLKNTTNPIERLLLIKDKNIRMLTPKELDKKIPEALNDMIMHALELHQTKYSEVYDFRRDLETFIKNEPYILKSDSVNKNPSPTKKVKNAPVKGKALKKKCDCGAAVIIMNPEETPIVQCRICGKDVSATSEIKVKEENIQKVEPQEIKQDEQEKDKPIIKKKKEKPIKVENKVEHNINKISIQGKKLCINEECNKNIELSEMICKSCGTNQKTGKQRAKSLFLLLVLIFFGLSILLIASAIGIWFCYTYNIINF